MSIAHEGFNAKRTYSQGASDYLEVMKRYWEYGPIETVKRANLQPGARVVDFGCGPGPATIYAAQQVGPNGFVKGIDAVDEMLVIAREQASKAGLNNIAFACGDFDALEPGDESFDAVTCSFALFFAKHIGETLRQMLTYLRPGGILSINTLGCHILAPLMPFFTATCQAENPQMSTYMPWTRLTDADVLRTLLVNAGAVDVVVETESTLMQLTTPQGWWDIVHGSGLRHLEMELAPDARQRVRTACEQWIERHNIRSIRTDTNYALAVKPA